MNWDAPAKPADLTETRLIDAFLDGTFPPESHLPAERELAQQLGVTRPTLREALQRLARDGWIEINHGRPTRVRAFWQEGSLGVLNGLAGRLQMVPADFVPNLLQIRTLLAPTYAFMAVQNHPEKVQQALHRCLQNQADAVDFARADWDLHRNLTIASGNPVFTLILNGFTDLYVSAATPYFENEQARRLSLSFYQDFQKALDNQDPQAAQVLTSRVMQVTADLWISLTGAAA